MKAEQFLKDGIDRIEFRNQLLDLIIGNTDDGDSIKLNFLDKNEIVNYLKEQIKEIEEE